MRFNAFDQWHYGFVHHINQFPPWRSKGCRLHSTMSLDGSGDVVICDWVIFANVAGYNQSDNVEIHKCLCGRSWLDGL